MPEQDWRAAGDRIDALIAAAGSGGAVARERAEELVRLVADVYGAGLERLLDLLHERGVLTGEALDAVAGDELVSSLLLVHGLHPYDVRTRVELALDGVSHGGALELVGVGDNGVVRLRLLDGGHGCGSSAAALMPAIEEAIAAAAPEVTAIELDQVAARAGPMIPVSALFARVGESATRATAKGQDGLARAAQP